MGLIFNRFKQPSSSAVIETTHFSCRDGRSHKTFAAMVAGHHVALILRFYFCDEVPQMLC